MSDNMRIWDAVSKTNPDHTKTVNQRGGFTAIAAHSQVLEATRQFGPIGIGWGYDTQPPIMLDGVVTVGVTVWHTTRDNHFGPVWGGADLRDSKGKLDSDAPKKATTDGLTKALSLLGFNADVFMGRFDDNKYVEQMRREFAGKEEEGAPLIDDAQRAELITLADQSGADLKAFCTYYKVDALARLPASKYAHARAMLNKKLIDKAGEQAA
jgi:hypothetical protein